MGRRFDPDRAHSFEKIRSMALREIKLINHRVPMFKVEESAELKYGPAFWDSVENGDWEIRQLNELCELGKSGDYFSSILVRQTESIR